MDKGQSSGARENMPHKEAFEQVECGGQGDCAYTSVGTALAQLYSAAEEKASPADLKPGGPIQAYLRGKAAKELRKNKEEYPVPDIEKVADGVARHGNGRTAQR